MSQTRHLSDDQLVHACLGGEVSPDVREHLRACAACHAEQLGIATTIDEVATSLRDEADAAFTEERLARQRSRILARIDQDGRPGRVVSFPAATAAAPRPTLRGTHPGARWVAAAAVAAFVVGLLTGQRIPQAFRPGQPAGAISQAMPREAAGAITQRTAPLGPSDEEFLGEVESAALGRPSVLQRIDALTAVAWEVPR